jgi:hypothetical protein
MFAWVRTARNGACAHAQPYRASPFQNAVACDRQSATSGVGGSSEPGQTAQTSIQPQTAQRRWLNDAIKAAADGPRCLVLIWTVPRLVELLGQQSRIVAVQSHSQSRTIVFPQGQRVGDVMLIVQQPKA